MRILGDYRKYFQTGTFTVTMPDCLRHRCACAGTDRAARTGHSVCYAPDSEKQVRVVATKTFSEYSARVDKEEKSTTSWNKWAMLLGYGPIKRIIIWKYQSRSVSFDANLTLLPSGLLIQYYLDAAGLICHSEMISGPVYALFAGFLGAAASLSAKLSLGADYLRDMCETGISGWTQTPGDTAACDWLHIPLRLLCGALLFACNAIMWTFFSKALRHCSSSARATVTTTASNFISSAVLGRLIFGESHAALWWVGISLTLCGLLVLHTSSAQTPPQEDKKDK